MAEASSLSSTTLLTSVPAVATAPLQVARNYDFQVPAIGNTKVQTQTALASPPPVLGLASFQLKDPMSFSLTLGVVILGFVLLRHVIGRARHMPL